MPIWRSKDGDAFFCQPALVAKSRDRGRAFAKAGSKLEPKAQGQTQRDQLCRSLPKRLHLWFQSHLCFRLFPRWHLTICCLRQLPCSRWRALESCHRSLWPKCALLYSQRSRLLLTGSKNSTASHCTARQVCIGLSPSPTCSLAGDDEHADRHWLFGQSTFLSFKSALIALSASFGNGTP